MPEKEISSQKCLQSYQACVGNTASLEIPVTGESLTAQNSSPTLAWGF